MKTKQAEFTLSAKDRAGLEKIVGDGNAAQKVAKRAKIVLMTADGAGVMAIMRTVGVSKTTVWRWQEYFVEAGVAGVIKGRSKPPGKKPLPEALKRAVVEKTAKERPAHATHWSVRIMGEEVGISHTSVQRIWKEYGLKPHVVRTFKVSNDPHFTEKMKDVVGLYLNPPEKALVLSVDEKSQIQALDRTQPSLPLKKGRAGTMTHDYKRHGTTTLFAALNAADGKVISMCLDRHRHQEWIKFLRLIDDATPDDKQLHLIVDNYATHKHPAVQRWLKRHPRFRIHFTPTSASWLNMVERFFRDLTVNRLRRGVFRDVMELVNAIYGYIDHHNDNPKPFIWTASAKDILEKVKRARKTLVNVQSV